MRPADPQPAPGHALLLGLLQGPTELLPVSSSAHTTLLPWLAGWPYSKAAAPARKSFEIALHAGAGLALLSLPLPPSEELPARVRERALFGIAALAPAATVGLLARRAIERHTGGPRSIAVGLLAGGLALAAADRTPEGPLRPATAADGLVLGLAQAAALIPGVSRNGATLTAARLRGLSRGQAQRLSWLVGLPALLGPAAVDGLRAARSGSRPQSNQALGAVAAFLSTRAFAQALADPAWRERPLARYGLYRVLLAGLVLLRLRRQETHR